MTIKPDSHYKDLYIQQDCKCRWCKEVFREIDLHRDHVLPRSKGYQIVYYKENDEHRLANVVLSCRVCNSIKSNMSLTEFEEHVRKLAEKSPLPKWDTILNSIAEVQEERPEELYIRSLEIAKQQKAEMKATQQKRKTLRNRAARKRKAERKKLERIRSLQSDSALEVEVYPQTGENLAPGPPTQATETSRSWQTTLFCRIKAFLNKVA